MKRSKKILALSCTALALTTQLSVAKDRAYKPDLYTALISAPAFNDITGTNAETIMRQQSSNAGSKTSADLTGWNGNVRIISGSDRCKKSKGLYPVFVYTSNSKGKSKKSSNQLPLTFVCANSKNSAKDLANMFGDNLGTSVAASSKPVPEINRQSVQSFGEIF